MHINLVFIRDLDIKSPNMLGISWLLSKQFFFPFPARGLRSRVSVCLLSYGKVSKEDKKPLLAVS